MPVPWSVYECLGFLLRLGLNLTSSKRLLEVYNSRRVDGGHVGMQNAEFYQDPPTGGFRSLTGGEQGHLLSPGSTSEVGSRYRILSLNYPWSRATTPCPAFRTPAIRSPGRACPGSCAQARLQNHHEGGHLSARATKAPLFFTEIFFEVGGKLYTAVAC